MAINRMKGNKLSFIIDDVEYRAEVVSVTLETSENDKGVVTFADAAGGGARKQVYKVKALQSTDPASLWSFIWDHVGEEVELIHKPWENEDPTPAQPHFESVVTVPVEPTLGGDAGRDGDEYTFESEFVVVGKVGKVTA
jgi:hypothetical protein